tara:strand:+ start:910 stop:1122 length:213 start_codon:yes stop_codon:yes gene_type:complete
MRIINIINNELVIKKQKLENDLEKALNNRDAKTQEQLDTCLTLIYELSNIDLSLMSWEKYITTDKEKKEN